jgi:DNA-binding transcriptional LysR family regulator
VLKSLSDRIRDKQLGLLRVAASAPPTFALLPRAAERFRRRNPAIRIELQTLPAAAIAERIMIGEIDLGVAMAVLAETQVRCELLGSAAIVAVVPETSPLSGLDAVTPAEVRGQTLISYGSNSRAGTLLDRAFEEAGVPREPQIEISLSIAAMPLVQGGLGIALVDGLVPWAKFGGLKVLPFRPTVSLDIVLATSALRPQTRYGREFGRDLRAAVAELASA